ncbi:MAG: hypothetical protein HQK78_11990 [Desulfobacterales bacterium]|nr:hypothetical protein [Desulfobacterales bacterium]
MLQEREYIKSLLERYCYDATIEEKKKFYFEKLSDYNFKLDFDKSLLDYLSPSGKLHFCKAKVNLIHDNCDTLIPPNQSKLIYNDLKKYSPSAQHNLLLTSLISHVSINKINFHEIFQLYKLIQPLFS